MADITLTNHFFHRRSAWIQCKKFPISLIILVFTSDVNSKHSFELKKKVTCTYFGLINGVWLETGLWLKIGMFGWKILLQEQRWAGALGLWGLGLSHTGPSVLLPGPGWVMLPEMLFCVWKEQRVVTGFKFWLIAFASGFMIETGSRDCPNYHPIQLPDPLPERPLWENTSLCRERLSILLPKF